MVARPRCVTEAQVKRRRQSASQLWIATEETPTARRIREGYELEEAIKRAYQEIIATKGNKQ